MSHSWSFSQVHHPSLLCLQPETPLHFVPRNLVPGHTSGGITSNQVFGGIEGDGFINRLPPEHLDFSVHKLLS